jgi:hypothetical protein
MRFVELAVLVGVGLLGGAVASNAPHAARPQSRGVWAHLADGPADDTVAARVALLALRASALGAHGPVDRYIMLPGLSPLEAADVIKALTALQKPAECSAWQEGNLMWLTCWSRDQVPNPFMLDALPGLAQTSLERLRKDFPGKTSLRVIVQDSGSRLPITDAQYEQFLSEYFVVPSAGNAVTDDHSSGADVLVTFHRSRKRSDNSP